MLVSFLSGGEIWGYLRNMGNFSPIPEAVWLLIYMSLCNLVMLFPHCVAGCWVPLFWPVVLTAWTVCAQVSCHSATLVLHLFTQVIILWMEPLCVPQGQVSFFGDSEADLITATQNLSSICEFKWIFSGDISILSLCSIFSIQMCPFVGTFHQP